MQVGDMGLDGRVFRLGTRIGDDFTGPPGAAISQSRPVPWPVKRGEVSFHHSLTWHGSPTNTSPRPRRAEIEPCALHTSMSGQVVVVSPA
jgi:hypothetical protein